jgi:hypothetical protein
MILITANDYSIDIILKSNDCETSTNYFSWFQKEENFIKARNSIIGNEQLIDKQFSKALEPDELFVLKFILQYLQTTTRLTKDPILLWTQMIFLKDNLESIYKQHSHEEIRVSFANKIAHNVPMIEFVKEISKGYKNVVVETKNIKMQKYNRYNKLMMGKIYPESIGTLLMAECMLGEITKKHRIDKSNKSKNTHDKVILSNFRHYAKDDEENIFWGNLIKLMKCTKEPDYEIIYYSPPSNLFPRMYFKQVKGKNHFLTNFLRARDYLECRKLYKHKISSIPKKMDLYYKKINYGKFLKSMVDSYFRIYVPFMIKNRVALRRMLKEVNPRIIFTDSELSIMAMQLSFIKGKSKLYAMSNEQISRMFNNLPYKKGRVRLSIDKKLVFSKDEIKMLVSRYAYPKNMLEQFPDPRILDSVYIKQQMTNSLIFISDGTVDIYDSALKIIDLFKKGKMLGKSKSHGKLEKQDIYFKTHPLHAAEEKRPLVRKIGAEIKIYSKHKLDFIPKYAITNASTLGFELMFRGTITFFKKEGNNALNESFGIAKSIPFLVCSNEDEVVKKLKSLESNPRAYNNLRKQISSFLMRNYGFSRDEDKLCKILGNIINHE